MNELERVRSQAVGQEVDQELMERYPVQSQEKMEFPTRYGTVTAYVYRPFSEQEKLPVLINFHGGGFVKGYRGRDFGFSRILAVNGQCLVVDVDYKIAPEYKYPYAVEEGYDLVRHIQEKADSLGGDSGRIVLSGESAGANMITAILFMLKKAGIPMPLGAVSCYPPYDLYTDAGEKPGAGQEPERVKNARLYNDWYVEPERRKEICASPVYASKEELTDLPPFTILAAEHDTLCQEALEFARKLVEAGVTVTAKKIKGARHGFLVRRTEGYLEGEALFFSALKTYFSDFGKGERK